METLTENKTFPFLHGGGEMGERTRHFNWSQSPVGPPEEWPQSLRTTVAMILSSRFPMFLWWGEDMIQFYNDAYRPSLGNEGKHPKALGQKAIDCWPEIWHIIYPLIEQVRKTGEATWSEDQLVPIYRNGSIEDVYWTFGYSPIRGDSDQIEGVLVVCHETTEKVQNILRLEESENRFRNLIHEATVGIVLLTGEDLVVEIANDAYARMVGRTTAQLLRKKLFSVIPETEPYFRHILENVRSTGEPHYQYDQPYVVMVDGKEKQGYLNLVYQPHKDYKGDTVGVMVLCHDITDQENAHKKLAESEHRYRTLIEEASVATGLYTGPELTIQYVNDIMTGYWGKDASVIGKPFRKALPELEGQPFYGLLQNVYATGVPYTGIEEKADLMKDGKLRTGYFNFTYKALKNKEGCIYAIHHMAIDVTAQVMAKKALEENERNLRNMILQSPVAMCIFKGPDYVLEIANDLMFEIWGRKADELLNRPIFEALPEIRNQGYEELLRKVFTTGKTYTANGLPVRVPRMNRVETIYVNFVYEAFREADGSISGIMAVAIDVTEQVLARHKIEDVVALRTEELAEANEALVRMNEELARSNTNLEEFAYAASHDMKEPIRKIHFFSNRLKTSLADRITQEEERFFDRMEAASRRMGSLIDDLLSYSHVSIKPRIFDPVELTGIMKQVLNDLELEIEEKQAVINMEGLCVIRGHQRQIQQAFQNLISNALKFHKPGEAPLININCKKLLGRDTPVPVSPEDMDHWFFMIEVRDNGIGFDRQEASRIFNVFTRLHGNTEYPGTGVGLSIVRKVAENHGGYVKAESEPDKGAIFQILFPSGN